MTQETIDLKNENLFINRVDKILNYFILIFMQNYIFKSCHSQKF
jgi:hypothetical protein